MKIMKALVFFLVLGVSFQLSADCLNNFAYWILTDSAAIGVDVKKREGFESEGEYSYGSYGVHVLQEVKLCNQKSQYDCFETIPLKFRDNLPLHFAVPKNLNQQDSWEIGGHKYIAVRDWSITEYVPGFIPSTVLGITFNHLSDIEDEKSGVYNQYPIVIESYSADSILRYWYSPERGLIAFGEYVATDKQAIILGRSAGIYKKAIDLKRFYLSISATGFGAKNMCEIPS